MSLLHNNIILNQSPPSEQSDVQLLWLSWVKIERWPLTLMIWGLDCGIEVENERLASDVVKTENLGYHYAQLI